MNRKILDIINKKQYKTGIEIGVRHGDSSKELIDQTCLTEIYGVDIRADEFVYGLVCDRYTYIIDNSVHASSSFENEYFDFIYIDAGHSYCDVYNDLSCWHPKLKTGGLMCGDDYLICHNPTEGHYGVVQASERFCSQNNIDLKLLEYEHLDYDGRLNLAKKNGKAVEDNLWLVHSYLFPPEAMNGRVRTENVPILNWYYYK